MMAVLEAFAEAERPDAMPKPAQNDVKAWLEKQQANETGDVTLALNAVARAAKKAIEAARESQEATSRRPKSMYTASGAVTRRANGNHETVGMRFVEELKQAIPGDQHARRWTRHLPDVLACMCQIAGTSTMPRMLSLKKSAVDAAFTDCMLLMQLSSLEEEATTLRTLVVHNKAGSALHGPGAKAHVKVELMSRRGMPDAASGDGDGPDGEGYEDGPHAPPKTTDDPEPDANGTFEAAHPSASRKRSREQ